jgi:hypothetical protein
MRSTEYEQTQITFHADLQSLNGNFTHSQHTRLTYTKYIRIFSNLIRTRI